MSIQSRGTQSGSDGNGERLLRLPAVLARIQISRSAWFMGVKQGRFPGGLLVSPRVRVWRELEIDSFIAGLNRDTQVDGVPGKRIRCGVFQY